jgi:RNA polymerase sigma factor (sigma-70 family)
MATAQLHTLMRHLKGLAADRQRTDRQLLEDFSACRDESAFTALLSRHGPMVLRVCRRVLRHEQDAEDAFQATFLVLARHTASIRKHEALASWLYGVAYRTATEVKRKAARRRNHEAKLRGRTPPAAPSPTWDDVQAVLDEEVQRLPGPFRAAFVCCVLDGQTVSVAASAQGVKECTLSWRLARARQRLRQQLARRGIELSAVLAALAVAQGAGKAAIPAALAGATIRFGLSVAAGGPAAVIPSHVAALAAGATRAMFLTKTKIAAVVLLAAVLFAAGTCVLTCQGLAAQGRGPAPAAESKQPGPGKDPGAREGAGAADMGSLTLSGQVLDPEGKPFAGAKLYLLDNAAAGKPPAVRAVTAADGHFRFAVAERDVRLNYGYADSWQAVFLVATAEGHGAAVSKVGKPGGAEERTLRVVKDDVPIRGRVIDLEGRPVAGATIRVDSLRLPVKDDLTAFLDALRVAKDGFPAENEHLTALYNPGVGGLFPEVTADRDGRFQLRGVGRERVVGLTIGGPTIETRQVRVRTRPGELIQRLAWKDFPKGDVLAYYGATFDHPGRPTQPVVGVVRDKDTGKPIPGAVVKSEALAGNYVHGRDFIRTTADKDGRYRLVGLPKGQGNVIKAAAPDGQPYLSAERSVPDGTGVETVTVDCELKRGVWVEGKVTDKGTGKPVPARVEYFVFADNPHLKGVAGLAVHQNLHTEADGTFRFIGLPGRGLVAARGDGDRHLVGVGAEKYEKEPGLGTLKTSPPCASVGYHRLVEVEVAPGADAVTCQVVLDPGRTLTGTVLGPDGQPLAGARAFGLHSYAFSSYWSREPLPTAEFTAYGLGEGRPRRLLFLHEGKKLGGTLLVRGDEKTPVQVKLEPWGAVTGRLVGVGGLPRAGADLRLDPVGDKLSNTDYASHPTRSFHADKDGKFRIEGLVPGMKYALGVVEKGVYYDALDFSVRSGETKDLGEVQVEVP